jgi:ribosomal protein L2
MVDFGRHSSMAGLVERLEYDPNRTGYIALVRYPAGKAATPHHCLEPVLPVLYVTAP